MVLLFIQNVILLENIVSKKQFIPSHIIDSFYVLQDIWNAITIHQSSIYINIHKYSIYINTFILKQNHVERKFLSCTLDVARFMYFWVFLELYESQTYLQKTERNSGYVILQVVSKLTTFVNLCESGVRTNKKFEIMKPWVKFFMWEV